MENPDVIRSALAHATGTGKYWRVFPENDRFLFTDGVKTMADMCEAYWLITAVFSWRHEPNIKDEPFQVWILSVTDDATAVLICEDGNNRELARQEIEYTDFPLPEGITLYLIGDILILPSEH